MNSNPDPDLERAKLQLDRERFVHEQELDQSKTAEEKRRTWLTAVSSVGALVAIFIPLLIAALTFRNASVTQERQAEDQLALQAQ